MIVINKIPILYYIKSLNNLNVMIRKIRCGKVIDDCY